MTAVRFDSTAVALRRAHPRIGGGENPGGENGATSTPLLPVYTSTAGTTRDLSRHDPDMVRLDKPYESVRTVIRNATTDWTISARLGPQVLGVASISPELPPGPPMRGFYRIHTVLVRGTDYERGGWGVIGRCIGCAAAHGGRTVWCYAGSDAVHTWYRYGFAPVGPPVAARDAGMLMTRPLTLADAGLFAP